MLVSPGLLTVGGMGFIPERFMMMMMMKQYHSALVVGGGGGRRGVKGCVCCHVTV